MDQDPITQAGKQIFGRFARISDPHLLDLRWSRLMQKVRDDFVDEARIAIETYLQLTER